MNSTPGPVALVSMPTLSARFPSFQLGLLKPTLEQHGIPAQTFSLFMYFGTHVGWRINEALADVYPCMVGEWIWTRAAFGDFADDEGVLPGSTSDNLRGDLRARRLHRRRPPRACATWAAPDFIDFCLESIDWSRFGLIGFSVVLPADCSPASRSRAR